MERQASLVDATVQAMLRSIRAPELAQAVIARRVEEAYGLSGEWRKLGGEREQNFRLMTANGAAFAVKVASLDEQPESLVFQAEALDHIGRVDPDLAVPRLRRTLDGQIGTHVEDEAGRRHPLRVLTFLPGSNLLSRIREIDRPLSMEELMALGAAQGRLARALQGFRGAGAPRLMPWDLSNGLVLGDWLPEHIPAEIRTVVRAFLPRLSHVIHEVLPRLRSQVIYNDFHESNVLVRFNPSLSVEGVIDFGDMVHGPVVQDLAVAVASLMHWTRDPVLAAGALVRGYQRSMPLEAADLDVLKDLVMGRLILQVGLVSYQTSVHGRQDEDLTALQALYTAAILRISSVFNDAFLSGTIPSVVPSPPSAGQSADPHPTPELLRRRETVLGKTYTFYNQPLELVRGKGCMLYDADGVEYLDCYNNVANLGHCHPYVVDALARQAGTLNTNSRYLHREIVRLGERLSKTLPPGLDTFIFVCTGSEANDLAVRMSRLMTGREGVIVTENSYHGNTSTVAPLSLIDYDIVDRPDWVETIAPPNLYRGLYRHGTEKAGEKYAGFVSEAARRLADDGRGAAALLVDSIFDANGALVPPADYLEYAFAAARRAGALTIADEVQMGFGRSGSHMWGFQAFGVEPDIVTMGKPMGNGHPVAAVATRREIAEAVQKRTGYFNTFGGNTVSAVVANACLDVLQGEDLQGNAARSGALLKAGLDELLGRHELVGHVHGRGLFYGVELVTQRDTAAPARFAARWVRERMKQLGVLVSSTGPFGNIIKIRPPLVFSASDVGRCLTALETALTEVPADQRKS